MLDGLVERRADRLDWRSGIWFGDGCLSLLTNPASSQKVDAPIVSDPEQPGRQRTRIVVRIQFSIGLKEGFLDDILAVEDRSCHAGTVAVEARSKMSNRLEKCQIPPLEPTTPRRNFADVCVYWRDVSRHSP